MLRTLFALSLYFSVRGFAMDAPARERSLQPPNNKYNIGPEPSTVEYPGSPRAQPPSVPLPEISADKNAAKVPIGDLLDFEQKVTPAKPWAESYFAAVRAVLAKKDYKSKKEHQDAMDDALTNAGIGELIGLLQKNFVSPAPQNEKEQLSAAFYRLLVCRILTIPNVSNLQPATKVLQDDNTLEIADETMTLAPQIVEQVEAAFQSIQPASTYKPMTRGKFAAHLDNGSLVLQNNENNIVRTWIFGSLRPFRHLREQVMIRTDQNLNDELSEALMQQGHLLSQVSDGTRGTVVHYEFSENSRRLLTVVLQASGFDSDDLLLYVDSFAENRDPEETLKQKIETTFMPAMARNGSALVYRVESQGFVTYLHFGSKRKERIDYPRPEYIHDIEFSPSGERLLITTTRKAMPVGIYYYEFLSRSPYREMMLFGQNIGGKTAMHCPIFVEEETIAYISETTDVVNGKPFDFQISFASLSAGENFNQFRGSYNMAALEGGLGNIYCSLADGCVAIASTAAGEVQREFSIDQFNFFARKKINPRFTGKLGTAFDSAAREQVFAGRNAIYRLAEAQKAEKLREDQEKDARYQLQLAEQDAAKRNAAQEEENQRRGLGGFLRKFFGRE